MFAECLLVVFRCIQYSLINKRQGKYSSVVVAECLLIMFGCMQKGVINQNKVNTYLLHLPNVYWLCSTHSMHSIGREKGKQDKYVYLLELPMFIGYVSMHLTGADNQNKVNIHASHLHIVYCLRLDAFKTL